MSVRTRTIRRLLASAGVATVATMGLAAPAQAMDPCLTSVCLFDNVNYTGLFFSGRGCGETNLGRMSPALNDRAESITNRTGNRVDLWDWRGERWYHLGYVSPYARVELLKGTRNVLDRITYGC